MKKQYLLITAIAYGLTTQLHADVLTDSLKSLGDSLTALAGKLTGNRGGTAPAEVEAGSTPIKVVHVIQDKSVNDFALSLERYLDAGNDLMQTIKNLRTEINSRTTGVVFKTLATANSQEIITYDAKITDLDRAGKDLTEKLQMVSDKNDIKTMLTASEKADLAKIINKLSDDFEFESDLTIGIRSYESLGLEKLTDKTSKYIDQYNQFKTIKAAIDPLLA